VVNKKFLIILARKKSESLLMKQIAAIILENDKGEFLLYLRDNKPGIPFPDHWDLIGGHVEEGETPEKALVREFKEELDLDLKEFTFYKKYVCLTGDAYENIKYIYSGKINLPVEKITLLEGVRPQYFSREEIPNVRFANILKSIVMEFISDHDN
jgi:8-oxo-dGTP diphosphatase